MVSATVYQVYVTEFLYVSFLSFVGATVSKRVDTIGCFTCSSFNGSDPGCSDPFSPAWATYEHECKSGKKDRIGVFPASYCIKMSGVSVSTGLELVVRTCSLTSMHHQCGIFEFEEVQYRGCLTTCEEDACNTGTITMVTVTLLVSIATTMLINCG